MSTLLSATQRVAHSVLTARIILNLRQANAKKVSGTIETMTQVSAANIVFGTMSKRGSGNDVATRLSGMGTEGWFFETSEEGNSDEEFHLTTIER